MPPQAGWSLPDPATAEPGMDLIGFGGDLSVATLVEAYSRGVFPMDVTVAQGRRVLGWWSPDPRAILPLSGLRVSDSLRRSQRRFHVTHDTAFGEVIRACAAARPEAEWITPAFRAAYEELHRGGSAHSVEVWADGDLAGGLYGVQLGGLFAGESMFHRQRDASKVALVALVEILRRDGWNRLLDVQWRTAHLGSLGAVTIPRGDYLGRLPEALSMPPAFPPLTTTSNRHPET